MCGPQPAVRREVRRSETDTGPPTGRRETNRPAAYRISGANAISPRSFKARTLRLLSGRGRGGRDRELAGAAPMGGAGDESVRSARFRDCNRGPSTSLPYSSQDRGDVAVVVVVPAGRACGRPAEAGVERAESLPRSARRRVRAGRQLVARFQLSSNGGLGRRSLEDAERIGNERGAPKRPSGFAGVEPLSGPASTPRTRACTARWPGPCRSPAPPRWSRRR